MRDVVALWRQERRARWLFAAHAQGALGASAGYVALLLLAYQRIGSGWAATAVLLADLIPSMLLGAALGMLIDRTSRLGCAIAADVLRTAAFAGLVLVDGTVAMVAFAAAAGVGTSMFRSATPALLPSLVGNERLAAANALYGSLRETGWLLGPALAAALLLATGPQVVLAVNAATFGISALLLTRLRGHAARPAAAAVVDGAAPARDGLAAIVADPVVRTLMATSGAIVLAGGMMNVAELVLAQRDLSAGGTGFALLVGAYGCGTVTGSLLAAAGEGASALRRRYLAGLALVSLGLAGSALAPVLGAAMLTFAVTGVGNALFLVSDRVLLQRLVPNRLHGRAFGLLDAIDSWGFAGAVLAGGALASSAGARSTFAVAAAGALAVSLAAARALRTPAFNFAPVPS
jgi:MFS family permease